MTNGVPFADLTKYVGALNIISAELMSEIGIGLIIDVSRAYYTPVQTRNKIYMKTGQKYRLIDFLRDSFYLYLMYRLSKKNTDDIRLMPT